jgi:pseudouridine kinase
MTEREQQIITVITRNPLINQSELAQQIGISRSAIASHITNLIAKGAIEGRGYVLAPDKFCIAIGGANMDILGKAGQTLTKQTSNPGSVSNSAGGVARNIAENIARLGEKCFLMSVVGDDNYGKQLKEISANAGVDTSHLYTICGYNTSSYLSIVDNEGEMQVAISDMAILDQLQPALIKKQLPLLKQAKVIVIDTNISSQLMQYLFDNLPDAVFFADTVSVVKATKILPFLQHIHSLKPNLLEAQTLSGINIDSYEQLPSLTDWFHQQGVQKIFISLGKDGLFYSHQPTNDEQVVQKRLTLSADHISNSNGAGDAMTAALVHAHIHNFDIEKSAYLALAAANCAISTKETINQTLSISTLNKLLKDSIC